MHLNLRARYILVGGINTVVGFLLFTCIFFLFEHVINYQFILVVAQILAVIFAHGTQRKFVWLSTQPYFNELVRFGSAYVAVTVFNIFLLHVAHEVFRFPVLVSQYTIGAVLILGNYFIQKHLIF